VRDAINLAHRSIPSVALVTTEFRAQADFVARSAGMPTIPRVILPHPVAGSGRANLAAVAESVADAIVVALRAAAPVSTSTSAGE
jgi:hypothetical protein